MELKHLHKPFEMEFLQTQEYSTKGRKNTFFEMVFVLKGKGIQAINDDHLPYGPDKLFLIFPSDLHHFEVQTETEFFFIRFNDSYLKTQSKEWMQKIEFIFHNHNHLPRCVLKNAPDKPLVRALIEALIREKVNDAPHRQEMMQQLVNTVISIAARNITLMAAPALKGMAPQQMAILSYVHQHIYAPDLLKASKIAAHFNISPTYISEYFKRQVGESLQQYVGTYKMRLVETRLQFTDMRVSEICSEFGFTDESHLNRLFKKYKGLSPSAWRRTMKQ